MTDPIADMLTRMRNALAAKHQKVDVPSSKLKLEIARILKEEGFITSYKVIGEGVRNNIRIYLRYGAKGEQLVSKLERVSLQDRLDALARTFGLHATDQWSVRLEGATGQERIAAVMAALKADPPGARAEPQGLPPADLVMLRIGDDRVVVRPSGTEPKLKMYFEVVIPVTGSMDGARAAARVRLTELRDVMARATGL